jgi:hypothetical protein
MDPTLRSRNLGIVKQMRSCALRSRTFDLDVGQGAIPVRLGGNGLQQRRLVIEKKMTSAVPLANNR